jgi:hypothetical protein
MPVVCSVSENPSEVIFQRLDQMLVRLSSGSGMSGSNPDNGGADK